MTTPKVKLKADLRAMTAVADGWELLALDRLNKLNDMARLLRVKQEQVDTAEHLARLEVQEDLSRIQAEASLARQERDVMAKEMSRFVDTLLFWQKELAVDPG